MKDNDSIPPERLGEIERVNVIGTSGSGKSTFGRQLANNLNLPYVEMDGVYWGPNWYEPPDDEYFEKVKEITERPKWVLDGNYSRTTPIKWQKVQMVVWLDMSFTRTLYRVTHRCIKRAYNKTEIWPGTNNRETFHKSFFSPSSVILWSITSYSRNRRRYLKQMQLPEYRHIWFVHLRHPRQVNSFLESASTSVRRS